MDAQSQKSQTVGGYSTDAESLARSKMKLQMDETYKRMVTNKVVSFTNIDDVIAYNLKD